MTAFHSRSADATPANVRKRDVFSRTAGTTRKRASAAVKPSGTRHARCGARSSNVKDGAGVVSAVAMAPRLLSELGRRHQVVDSRLEVGERLRADDAPERMDLAFFRHRAEKKGRRSANPRPQAFLLIGANARRRGRLCGETLVEARHVQACRLG